MIPKLDTYMAVLRAKELGVVASFDLDEFWLELRDIFEEVHAHGWSQGYRVGMLG